MTSNTSNQSQIHTYLSTPVLKQCPHPLHQVKNDAIPPQSSLNPCRVIMDHRNHCWFFHHMAWSHFRSCPKKLPKIIATAKGHLRQDRQNVKSTRNTSQATTISNPHVMTTPPLPLHETKVRTQTAYLQTREFAGKVSTDQTGRFPITSSRGSKYLMVLYDHDSNTILAEPLTSRNERELIRATRILHAYLFDRGFTPQYQILDNECPGGLKTFLCEASVKFQLVPPYLHHTNTV